MMNKILDYFDMIYIFFNYVVFNFSILFFKNIVSLLSRIEILFISLLSSIMSMIWKHMPKKKKRKMNMSWRSLFNEQSIKVRILHSIGRCGNISRIVQHNTRIFQYHKLSKGVFMNQNKWIQKCKYVKTDSCACHENQYQFMKQKNWYQYTCS